MLNFDSGPGMPAQHHEMLEDRRPVAAESRLMEIRKEAIDLVQSALDDHGVIIVNTIARSGTTSSMGALANRFEAEGREVAHMSADYPIRVSPMTFHRRSNVHKAMGKRWT